MYAALLLYLQVQRLSPFDALVVFVLEQLVVVTQFHLERIVTDLQRQLLYLQEDGVMSVMKRTGASVA